MPRTWKAAFIKYDAGLLGILPSVVICQFNPEQLSRVTQAACEEAGGRRRQRLQATLEYPAEALEVQVRLDSRVQVDEGSPQAAVTGVYPAISALELMVYPRESLAIGGLAGGGASRRKPPLVLFVWGAARVMPVRVTRVQVTETEFDALLTPTRAEVSVAMQVLTPRDVDRDSLAHYVYQYHMGSRETAAALNLANLAALGGIKLSF